MKNSALEKACFDFGGQNAVAKALGVSQGLVNQWIHGRTRITAERALHLVELFEFRVNPEDLCPDARWDIARRIK